MIKFPKEVKRNDYYKVVKEAKYDFDEAVTALTEELKKSGIQFPENIAEDIADIAYTGSSCKWGQLFESWTERQIEFDQKGFDLAVAIYAKERANAVNSLLTLEATESHPKYEAVEEYLETGVIRPISDNYNNNLSDRESLKYINAVISCLCQGGDGLVRMIKQYYSSPLFAVSEEDKKRGIKI